MEMTTKAAAVFLFLSATASLFSSTQAATYIVGDTTGWTSPSSTEFYDNWTSGKTFRVGDVLVFNFATGVHDVATATEPNYEACNTANTLTLATTGPVSIPLNTTGEHYFFCTISSHCSRGQKLDIDVLASTSTSGPSGSPPGTTPTTTTSPPPPSSSASSIAAATIPVFLVAVAMALMC